MLENLAKVNKDETWVWSEVNKMGIKDMKDVFFAVVDNSGDFYATLGGKEKEETPGKYGIE